MGKQAFRSSSHLSVPFPCFPINAIYTWAVAIVFLFVMVFLWAITWAVIVPLRNAVTPVMAQFANHTSYANWTLADTFMYNFWVYFLVLSTIAILLWSFHYAQQRGVRTA